MKLGAQLFSVRTFLQSEWDLRQTFQRIKEIGYENVQLSGAAAFSAELIREVSEQNGLPVVCTHTSFDRILQDTDNVICEHRIFGCPVVGLGMMPKEYRGSREGLEAFLKTIETPVRKIMDAGLSFAYHNHAFEFLPFEDGGNAYDTMLEHLPDWHFIMDTYWVEFAGQSAAEYIRRIGKDRLVNIHFKDMATDEKRSICACGDGCLDFVNLHRICQEVGVQNVLVEQDNAVNASDPFMEMESSFRHLRPIIFE